MLKAYRPELDASAIKQIVLGSVDAIPALTGRVISGGRLNVHRALLTANDLAVTASTGRVSKGVAGGPFDPASSTYVVTNYGAVSANWTVTHQLPWIDLSRNGGILPTGASAVITVAPNPQPPALAEGIYHDAFTFTNTTTGHTQTCVFALYVGQFDYSTEFFDYTPANPETGAPARGSKAFDLEYTSFTFVPDNSPRGYQVFREPAAAFRTDPAGGTRISANQLSSLPVPVALENGQTVEMYGVRYSTLYVTEEGWIGFEGFPDPGINADVPLYFAHFYQPHISALYAVYRYSDFVGLGSPPSGTISWKQLEDRVAVTYDGVTHVTGEFSVAPNTFQTEMFFDGRIRITYLKVNKTAGLVGLSRVRESRWNSRRATLAPTCFTTN